MSDLSVGTSVAGYRVESVIGHGSMGTVYSAEEGALERRVALKVLAAELSRDERFRERFLRESKLAASLEHPHIVPIYSAGEADGVLYLAMRYVEGRDLGVLLKSLGRLEPERTLVILGQVAGALDTAHARGLVHRDVKPANILLARDSGSSDYAFLADFGLAKHTSTVSSLTRDHAVVGTIDYLAPEQIEGLRADGRVDVYALGCVLYECLVGAPPFARGNDLASILAHAQEPAPLISERRPELPAAFDDVIATALAKDRNLRYATCGDLLAAAGAALRAELQAPIPIGKGVASLRTFVFADVRGYTSYTREQGDEAGAALARSFAAIVGELAPVHEGTLQELRGDEALVVFDSARGALRFAVELQRRFSAAALPRGIGVGLDAGEAVPVGDGFRGGALNRAARLCALARPGEVIASASVVDLAGKTDGVAYGMRRVERLKGFDKPVGIVEIHASEKAPQRELGRRLRRALVGSRPRLRLLVALALVAVGVAVAVPLALLGGGKAAAPPFKLGAIGLLDAKTLKSVGTFDELGSPGVWQDSSGQIWAPDFPGGSIARIDPLRRKVTARFALNISPNGMAWGDRSLWVGDGDHPAVVRYDPQYGTVAARIPLPAQGLAFPDLTNGLAYGAGAVWAAYGKYPFRIARIDPRTNRVVKTIDLQHAQGQALLAFGEGGLWVASQDTGRLWRIDPATDAVVATAKLHRGWVEDLRVVNGYAWAPIENDRAVWKVDASGNVLKSITTGDLPHALGSSGADLFVVNQKSASISRIDTTTDAVTTVRVGHRPEGVAAGGGLLWVPLAESPTDATATLSGKDVVHVVTEGNPLSTDPALSSASGPQNQLEQAIGARLLRYPDVAQPNGATLQPEIADLPKVSNGGRTYTFRIRPGYRFSPPSGTPVTAEVMRYTIERALSPAITDPGAQGYNLVGDIAGVAAYRAGKASHISGVKVNGDKLTITIAKPAADFPARISLLWFSAVPLGTPALPHGVDRPVPSAGPYYLSSQVGDLQEVVRRNPNYSGPRPHAIEAFVFENGVATPTGADRVSAHTADYVWDDQPPYPPQLASGGKLEQRLGDNSPAAKKGHQQYFAPQVSAVRYVDFNTTRGIFTDPKLRRAVNYAIDRRALAATFGSTQSADPIPPGIPGAGATSPYPLNGPNIAAAQALSGRKTRRALLFTEAGCSECDQAAAVLRRDLGRIGIQLRVKSVDSPFGEAAKPHSSVDLMLGAWFADYPDPADFLNELFDPRPSGYGYALPYHHYGDTRWINRMRRAATVVGPGRATVYRELVGRMMRQSPPTAVFAIPRQPVQLFSENVGCQVFRPQDYGYVDLAALCLRGSP